MSDTAQTASLVFLNGERETEVMDDTPGVTTSVNPIVHIKPVDRNNIIAALTLRTVGSSLDKHGAYDGDNCVICLEAINTGDEVVDFKCKHTYNPHFIPILSCDMIYLDLHCIDIAFPQTGSTQSVPQNGWGAELTLSFLLLVLCVTPKYFVSSGFHV